MARAGGVLKPSATRSRWLPQDPSGSTFYFRALPGNQKWEDSEFSQQTTNNAVFYNYSRLIAISAAEDYGVA